MPRRVLALVLTLLPAPALADCVSADVVVYGGAPAGVAAAVEASREGRRVILLEPTDHVGGIVANGLTRADVSPHEKKPYGGEALAFLQAMKAEYPHDEGQRVEYEAKGAEAWFVRRLSEAGVDVRMGKILLDTSRAARSITALNTADGASYCAKMFIDASYEGDLLAAALTPFSLGRESKALYGEPDAGVQQRHLPGYDVRDAFHVSSYVTPDEPSSGLVFGVEPDENLPEGAGDGALMAFNFRFCASGADDRIPFARPASYDGSRYDLQRRWYKSEETIGLSYDLTDIFAPSLTVGAESDVNSTTNFSTDIVGFGRAWVEADWTTRRAMLRAARDYTQGLLYFLGHDPDVPSLVRDEMGAWGLCAGEFLDNGHWPRQIYVREGRRLVGPYVFTENDILNHVAQADPIGLGFYPLDSHVTTRANVGGFVMEEGKLPDSAVGGPYQIPMRVLYGGVYDNLLAAVGVSASRAAFLSLRVEPTLMVLGQAAGALASAAVVERTSVQKASYAAVQAALTKAGQVLSAD